MENENDKDLQAENIPANEPDLENVPVNENEPIDQVPEEGNAESDEGDEASLPQNDNHSEDENSRGRNSLMEKVQSSKNRLLGIHRLLKDRNSVEVIKGFVENSLKNYKNHSPEINAASFRSVLDNLVTVTGKIPGLDNLVYKIVVIGDTSVGKDMVCAQLLGVPVHYSSKDAATSRWDHISHKYDSSLQKGEIRVKVKDNATSEERTFDNVEEAKEYRKTLHPDLVRSINSGESFGSENCVITEISEGDETVYPVSFWNAVGLIAGNSDGGPKILEATNKRIEEIAEQGNAAIFLVRRVTTVGAMEMSLNLEIFRENKHLLKNVEVVVVNTCGDLIEVDSSHKTFKDYAEKNIFNYEGFRKSVPIVRNFLITNWAFGNDGIDHWNERKEFEKGLHLKMKTIVENVIKNAENSYLYNSPVDKKTLKTLLNRIKDEEMKDFFKDKVKSSGFYGRSFIEEGTDLLSSCNNSNFVEFFRDQCTSKSEDPFLKFHESIESATMDLVREYKEIKKESSNDSIEYGPNISILSKKIMSAKKLFVNIQGLGPHHKKYVDQLVEKNMETGEEECQRISSDHPNIFSEFPPEEYKNSLISGGWSSVVSRNKGEDWNIHKYYSLSNRLDRIKSNLLYSIEMFVIPDIDKEKLTAQASTQPYGNVIDRNDYLFAHILECVENSLKSIAPILSTYLADMSYRSMIMSLEFCLATEESGKIISKTPSLERAIRNAIRTVYYDDVKERAEYQLKNFIALNALRVDIEHLARRYIEMAEKFKESKIMSYLNKEVMERVSGSGIIENIRGKAMDFLKKNGKSVWTSRSEITKLLTMMKKNVSEKKSEKVQKFSQDLYKLLLTDKVYGMIDVMIQVGHQFSLFDILPMGEFADENFLFKHIALEILKVERIFELIKNCNNDIDPSVAPMIDHLDPKQWYILEPEITSKSMLGRVGLIGLIRHHDPDDRYVHVNGYWLGLEHKIKRMVEDEITILCKDNIENQRENIEKLEELRNKIHALVLFLNKSPDYFKHTFNKQLRYPQWSNDVRVILNEIKADKAFLQRKKDELVSKSDGQPKPPSFDSEFFDWDEY